MCSSTTRTPRKHVCVYVLYLKPFKLFLSPPRLGAELVIAPKVYLSGGRPLFVLSDAQQEEVIAQADSHLRTAKGRGYRRQVTRAEVSDLLSGLPRDSAGLASCDDAQKLILGYREKQIARFKVIFPDTVTKSGITPPSRRRMMSSAGDGSSSGGSGSVHGPEAAEVVGNGVGVRDGCLGATTVPAGGSRSKAGGSICSMSKNKSVECFRGAGAGGEKAASRTRGDKFSADVAPPEMFVKDVGFTPAGMAKHVSICFLTAVEDENKRRTNHNLVGRGAILRLYGQKRKTTLWASVFRCKYLGVLLWGRFKEGA